MLCWTFHVCVKPGYTSLGLLSLVTLQNLCFGTHSLQDGASKRCQRFFQFLKGLLTFRKHKLLLDNAGNRKFVWYGTFYWEHFWSASSSFFQMEIRTVYLSSWRFEFFPSINCLRNSFLLALVLDGGCESLWGRKNRLRQMFHIQLFQMEN